MLEDWTQLLQHLLILQGDHRKLADDICPACRDFWARPGLSGVQHNSRWTQALPGDPVWLVLQSHDDGVQVVLELRRSGSHLCVRLWVRPQVSGRVSTCRHTE